MFQKMRIFSAVARMLSFTEAAAVLGISQSAVSQCVAGLERALGVRLIDREGRRRLVLTPAGRRFAEGAAEILASVDRLEQEMKTGLWEGRRLSVGCSALFRGEELRRAIMRFAKRRPDVQIEVRTLSHEAIYGELLSGRLDLALSDQRRAFSGDFENIPLAQTPVCAEFAPGHPLSSRRRLSASDLQPYGCILVVQPEEREAERAYYARLLGFRGSFLFAETLEAARLMAAGGRCFVLAQGRWGGATDSRGANCGGDCGADASGAAFPACIPVFKSGHLVKERICAFALKSRRTALSGAFLEALSAAFAESYPEAGEGNRAVPAGEAAPEPVAGRQEALKGKVAGGTPVEPDPAGDVSKA